MNPRLFRATTLSLAVSFGAFSAHAASQDYEVVTDQEQSACRDLPFSIGLTVKNIKKAKGVVTIDLHGGDPERFMKKGAKLARLRYPAGDGEMTVCVPVEQAGRYAIVLYHDRDGDGKFDKTWIGLPDEPYGLSNDAPPRLGKPRYDEVSFEVTGPMTPVVATLSK
ncbi:MAG: DUF2141 domain-containing protein [Rhodobacteraceae bacterium]|nr:DUF2141 domain-containing protein [Paracoccaceae bacterium]